MIKMNATIAAAMAALLMAGSAMAATPADQSGNEPYESEMAATTSQVTRGAVEAEAAQHEPAAGQEDPAPAATADPQSTLTRKAVEQGAAVQEPAAGQEPFESK